MATCGTCRGEGKIITEPCSKCKASGRERRVRKLAISIPAGIEEGTQMRITAEGEAGAGGGPPGDLYVSVQVQEHAVFERDDHNILYTLPVNVSEVALGAEVTVPTLEGDVVLEIPGGTQPGQVFRIRGKGVPHLRSNKRGDQLVRVAVQTPRTLTEEQRRLYQELAISLADQETDEDPEEKTWIGKIKDAFGNPE
jgi:molecular chaperone DnaJ